MGNRPAQGTTVILHNSFLPLETERRALSQKLGVEARYQARQLPEAKFRDGWLSALISAGGSRMVAA
jgi:hypothetical protein